MKADRFVCFGLVIAQGILSLMGVARIDSIVKYGSIPVFRALLSVFFTVLIARSNIPLKLVIR